MNIQEARETIKQAKVKNSISLNLSSYKRGNAYGEEKLTSEDLAEILPEIKKITELTTLNLRNNQISDIETLGQLTKLTTLNLRNNQISNIEALEQLTGLKSLNLRDNQLGDIEVLRQLIGLTSLYLRGNQITDIKALGQLTRLTILDLRNNLINDAEALRQLVELTTLNLIGNQISDIGTFEQLSRLITLNLSDNRISDLKALGGLTRLTSLDLRDNQISDIEALGQLTGLTSLDLKGNQISDIKALGQLTEIKLLNLSNNQISNIEALGRLTGLTELNLSENQLSGIEVLGGLTRLKLLDLSANLTIEKLLPVEVLNDYFNPQRIINYLLKVKDGKPINEAKIVVVGEADYGKTLLINRLVNDSYIPTERTHGIIITKWEDVDVNDQKVKLNIWDFGGQKIMQNTHQYFFTERTLYILVLNARQNEASNKTKEHLERIKTIAGNSPIIVVGNKVDTNKGEFDINRSELREKFNIKGFFGVCSNQEEDKDGVYDANFDEFRKAVIAEIGKLDGIHKPFKEEWFAVKDYLESLKEDKLPFITYHDYLKYCFDKQVREAIDQTEIVTFLNELGLVVYLQKKKDGIAIEIGDKLIFNPEWLISGVYAVIDNPQKLKRRAILDYETFTEILNECKPENYVYQPEDYKYVLNMMLACKLCVKMKNSETDYLIPDHLPEDKSKVLQEYEVELGNLEFKINFQFKYKELFDDIFRRFLIAMYDNVYDKYYWKTGVVLTDDHCKALVTADNAENKITIKIEGESSGKRKNFLAVIHKAFRDIYKTYPNLDYSEWIAHKDYPNILKSYGELLSIEENIREDAERKVYCEELKRFEHIDNFLDNVRIIERDKKEEEQNRMGNGDIINNYGNMQVNKDQSTGHQYNYAAGKEIEGKLDLVSSNYESKFDEILSKQTEAKADYERTVSDLTIQIQNMLNEMLSVIGSGLDFLNDEEQRRYEALKHKPDWESTLTFVVPVLDKFGVKIETKTKLENLPKKYRDQIELIRAKGKTLFGNEFEANELEESQTKGELNP
jgi:internalin A